MDLSGYRHVIWDWNGTLLNDAWLGVEILNGILVSRHRPAITLDEYQEEFCIPVKPYYEKLGFDFSVESYDAISTEFIENYDLRRFECELQEHALAVLRSVPRRGMSQSILTAYQQCRLEEIILHFQIGDFFVEMLGLDNHYASSKIENGRRLVESLGISPLDILLIGDTLHDYEVARAIGVDCVLVASGHTSRERLETAGCCVLGSLGEVGS
ncbi:MAG: HAD family hydrolase [Phycisphaerae bacterium]|nr:HAD family hydrolase [Phycisphaerae bacterium]